MYKVLFADNKVVSCEPENEDKTLNSTYQYAHKKGQLIYALVNARNYNEAMEIADLIIEEFRQRVFLE